MMTLEVISAKIIPIRKPIVDQDLPASLRLSNHKPPVMKRMRPAAKPNVSAKKVGEIPARITPSGAPIMERMEGHIVRA